MATINQTVLMSSPEFFDDSAAINPFMDRSESIDIAKATAEHQAIKQALESAGVTVKQVKPPENCQDGVYTANWALVRDDIAVMSTLPEARKGEEPYAERILRDLGKTVLKVPNGWHFSGQGDALPCGNYLFMGTGYRTDPEAHQFIGDTLGYQVVSLQAIPVRNLLGIKNNRAGQKVINKSSGWPDSFFYDIDLAISVLKPATKTERGLIAWCPQAFTKSSRQLINSLGTLDKIEVSLREAQKAFACNLVSTGETVIMSAHAPQLKAWIEGYGLRTITPNVTELGKGGGYIRCTTLTLDN